MLLFDGDIGLANVDVQLGLTPQRDLSSVISGRHTFERRYYAIIPKADSTLSPGAPARRRWLCCRWKNCKRWHPASADLQKNYDFVVIDLGAGIEQHVQYLASLAARCLVVVTDEPTSLTDAYAFIKIAASGKSPPDMGIVVNQASTQKEGEATYHALNKACVNFLNISPPLIGIIRRDNKVKDSIRNQKSLITRAPHSTAATDAAVLSIKLMQK